MAPPFASSDYNTIIIDSSNLIDRTIKGIDIGLGTIELNNLSASAIASLGGGGLTQNSVNSSHIINGTIGTEDISDNAITSNKIADGSIIETKLGALAVTHDKIDALAVTEAKINTGAVTNTKLGALAVTHDKIDALAITEAKIQPLAVSIGKLSTEVQTKLNNPVIADGSIAEIKLATAFLNRIYNLEYPGFYGSLKIQNSNTSGAGSTITFTLNSQTLAGAIQLLGSTTLTVNQHIDVPILIQNRLLNKDTLFNIVYSTTSSTITSTIPTGVSVTTPIVSPNIYFSVLPAYIHNGTIQLGIVLPAPGNTGWYGNIYMEILSYRSISVSYNYTIYKGSTTSTPILTNAASVSTLGYGTVGVSSANILTIADRLPNNTSSFLIVINSATPDFRYESISNATYSVISATQYLITPTTANSDIRVRFAIESP